MPPKKMIRAASDEASVAASDDYEASVAASDEYADEGAAAGEYADEGAAGYEYAGAGAAGYEYAGAGAAGYEDVEEEQERIAILENTYNFADILSRSYAGLEKDIDAIVSYCAPKMAANASQRAEFMWNFGRQLKRNRDAVAFIKTCRNALQGNTIMLPFEVRCYVNTIVRDLWIALHVHHARALIKIEDKEMAALTTVKDVVRFNILYLQGKTFTSCVMRGPINPETIPLLANLVRLHHYGVITSQGQPSLIDVDHVSEFTGEPFTNHQRAYLHCMVRKEDWVELLAFLQRKKMDDPALFGFGFVNYESSEVFETELFRWNREVLLRNIDKPAVSRYLSVSWYLDNYSESVSLLASRNKRVYRKFQTKFTVFLKLFALKSSSNVSLEGLLLEFFETRSVFIPFEEDTSARLDPFYGALVSVRQTLNASTTWLPETPEIVAARAHVLLRNYEAMKDKYTSGHEYVVSVEDMPPGF